MFEPLKEKSGKISGSNVAILPLIDQGQGHHMGPDFKVKIKDLRNHITRYLADLIYSA
jgi:hypothetical protein